MPKPSRGCDSCQPASDSTAGRPGALVDHDRVDGSRCSRAWCRCPGCRSRTRCRGSWRTRSARSNAIPGPAGRPSRRRRRWSPAGRGSASDRCRPSPRRPGGCRNRSPRTRPPSHRPRRAARSPPCSWRAPRSPGPLLGLTTAITGTLGCACLAAMSAAQLGSDGKVYSGTIDPVRAFVRGRAGRRRGGRRRGGGVCSRPPPWCSMRSRLPVLVLVLVGVCLELPAPDALELAVSSTNPVSPAPPPPHPAPVAAATATTPASSRPFVMLPDLELVLFITPSYAGRNPTGRSFSNLVRRR